MENWIGNTNTEVTINGIPAISGTSGIYNEPLTGNNHFGSIGGNVIQDSLDLFRANTPDHGSINITYGSPFGMPISGQADIPNSIPNIFRILEISGTGVEVLPDQPEMVSGDITYNRMMVNKETEVYYRIEDREQELCLNNSTLNGIPLNEYNIIFGEPNLEYDENSTFSENEQLRRSVYANNEIYITKLDNHRRRMSFLTPFRSNELNPRIIPMYLTTTRRRFYFAIARDNIIESVAIYRGEYDQDPVVFNPLDRDPDGVYRVWRQRDEIGNVVLNENGNPIIDENYYAFYEGEILDISLRFTTAAAAIQMRLIQYYLADCFIPETMILPSNNFVQKIKNFRMPQRDVLLFLKTVPTFTLTINVIDSIPPRRIAQVIINNELFSWNGQQHPSISENNPDLFPDGHPANGFPDQNVFEPEADNNFLPVIRHYGQGDLIRIRVDFIEEIVNGRDENRFTRLDIDRLISQFDALQITTRRVSDNTFFGSQWIDFNMPGHDLTLNIRTNDQAALLQFHVDGFPLTESLMENFERLHPEINLVDGQERIDLIHKILDHRITMILYEADDDNGLLRNIDNFEVQANDITNLNVHDFAFGVDREFAIIPGERVDVLVKVGHTWNASLLTPNIIPTEPSSITDNRDRVYWNREATDFYELDRDFILSQLPTDDVSRVTRKIDRDQDQDTGNIIRPDRWTPTNPYPDNPAEGSGSYQLISFLMPDVSTYRINLRTVDNRMSFSINRNELQDRFQFGNPPAPFDGVDAYSDPPRDIEWGRPGNPDATAEDRLRFNDPRNEVLFETFDRISSIWYLDYYRTEFEPTSGYIINLLERDANNVLINTNYKVDLLERRRSTFIGTPTQGLVLPNSENNYSTGALVDGDPNTNPIFRQLCDIYVEFNDNDRRIDFWDLSNQLPGLNQAEFFEPFEMSGNAPARGGNNSQVNNLPLNMPNRTSRNHFQHFRFQLFPNQNPLSIRWDFRVPSHYLSVQPNRGQFNSQIMLPLDEARFLQRAIMIIQDKGSDGNLGPITRVSPNINFFDDDNTPIHSSDPNFTTHFRLRRGTEIALWVELPRFGYILDTVLLRAEFPNRTVAMGEPSPDFFIGEGGGPSAPLDEPTFIGPNWATGPLNPLLSGGWLPTEVSNQSTNPPRTDMLYHGMRFFIDDRNILADLIWRERYPKLTIRRNPTQQYGNEAFLERPLTQLAMMINNLNPLDIPEFEQEMVVEAGATIDVYVKFTDIYQHLEKRHLWNQIPLAQVQEAGEFNEEDLGGAPFDPVPILPPEIG